MNRIFKKYKFLMLSILTVVILIGGYYFFVASKSAKPEEIPKPPEELVLTLKPEEIGLTMSARSDNKAIKFTISNPQDITSIEYQVTYQAEGDIPRGVIGNIEVKENDEIIESNYIDLGTCSANKCKYDVVVSPIQLLLKITKKDGKSYQVESTLEL